MADVTVQVLEPATSFAMLTLDEARILLAIPTGDVSGDAQIQLLIDMNSAQIAAKCGNRVFARETVREYWRELQPPRLFLTHWPVSIDDIESVETPEGSPITGYQLEESSGKILLPAGSPSECVVQYTGGYYLPDAAPMALKQATGLLVSVTKSEQQQAALSGVRMISHKSSRVMFHPPQANKESSGGTSAATRSAIDALCMHFTRHWI